MPKIILFLAAIVIGMIAAPLPTPARVFWSRPAAAGHPLFETTPDWKSVYESTVTINGAAGRLRIFGCPDSLPAVMRRLRTAFANTNKKMDFQENESLGQAIVQDQGRIIRLLALGLPVGNQTLLFVVSQTPADYDQSRSPPGGAGPDLPVFPGSRLQTLITDDQAQATIAIAAAAQRPAVIQGYFQETLAAQGWQSVLPAGAEFAGVRVYQKGSALCCVLIQSSDRRPESTITLLHKRLRME